MRNNVKLGMAVLAAMVAAGCASLSTPRLKETAEMKTRLDSLESQVAALNQRLEDLAQQQQPAQGATRTLAGGAGSQKAGATAKTPWTVRQTQRALAAAGFYKGAIDGKDGPQTRKALKEFQQANGLKSDGIVGPATTAMLGRYLEAERE